MNERARRLEQLDGVIRDVVAPQAERVDRERAFPSEGVAALREAGLLGLISAPEVGGLGFGLGAAVDVVERLARACGSTAMVTCMHYAGAGVIEAHGPEAVRRDVAAGRHLSTLAFSEAGSRSHFWAPVSSARRVDDGVALDARKGWVTSANHATAYVWSSRTTSTAGSPEGASTLWLVPRETAGLTIPRAFDGMGLRGNDSAPVEASGAVIPAANRLGEDGQGFQLMMEVVLPRFNLMIAATSVGLMEGALARTTEHVAGTRYEHLDARLADLPTVRAFLARMRVRADMARTLLQDAVSAVEAGREDAMLRVLEVKAGAGDAALEVLDLAMRVCGGAAFRKDVAVERYFRDGRAASVMAPTSDQLYDFIGKALCGLPLFE